MDYEAWRCTHDIKLMCPEEGCTLTEGCARDRGWDGTQPGPRNGEPINQGELNAPSNP